MAPPHKSKKVSMAKTKVSVIILNWNGKKDTIECLGSVYKSKTLSIDLDVYLVDNDSSDKTLSVVQKKFPQTKTIANSSNLGFSAGNNIGIKAALGNSADYIILLNNDTTVHPNTFESLVDNSQKHGFSIASPKIYFYPGKEFHKSSYKKKRIFM